MRKNTEKIKISLILSNKKIDNHNSRSLCISDPQKNLERLITRDRNLIKNKKQIIL